jgi:cysteine synthase A
MIRGLHSVSNLIGDTPMLKITFSIDMDIFFVYAKLESYNLTGSIKDRVAYHILDRAYTNGNILPGQTIIEASSGNMGISFAALGGLLGHDVIICMPDWLSKERYELLELYGATIVKFSKADGGFKKCIEEVERLSTLIPSFLPRQFQNDENIQAHYISTCNEISRSMAAINSTVDAFVAGVGTGGTIMGAAYYFHDFLNKKICHPIEPASSPILSGDGSKGHKIQGISDEFIPDIVDLNLLHSPIQVTDDDALLMAKMLNMAGISVGISSGANIVGALKLQRGNFVGNVATVLPDCGKKYLSTDLPKTSLQQSFDDLPHVEILDIQEIF